MGSVCVVHLHQNKITCSTVQYVCVRVSYICSLGAAFLSSLQVTRENWAPEPDKDIQLAGVHGRPHRPVRAELELGDILYWRSAETRYLLISSGCSFSNFSVGISNIRSAHMAVGHWECLI